MSVLLPSSPAPREITPRLITARNELSPAFGGAVQRINRKGSRYAIDFVMPPMTYAESMAWIDLQSEDQTVIMAIPQPGVEPGAATGPTAVKGAGQAGSVLVVDGFAPGFAVQKGVWLSVATGGQRWLHRVAADVTASGVGEASLPLQTMLRQSPSDNAVVNLDVGYIEGYAKVAEDAWTVGPDRLVYLKFTIEERE